MAEAQGAEREGSGLVLVVDDDRPICEAMGRLLQGAGFDVATAGDGASALERLGQGGIDVLVSDIAMPAMDGIALMRAVRAVDLDLPVILVTGDPTLETAQQAVDLGAFRYLTKPTDGKELISTVRRAHAAYGLARLKREALDMLGGDAAAPGDAMGLGLALDRAMEGLWMAFQPIVRADGGSLYGYEALMRSREPLLPHPGAVLDAAERLGRLTELGRLTRGLACKPMLRVAEEVHLFVNLAPQDLLDDSIYRDEAPLHQIAPRVVLEITERASLSNVSEVRQRVATLRERGYRIAVDDLGAGYAGLTSLATLEPDIIKIDMSLVRDVERSPIRQKLIRAMVALCKDTGTLSVAEGVETAAERDVLVQLGCDLLQGYFIARPDAPFPEINW